MRLFPWLLLHPNVPKPLHGLAPRVILGDSWWREQKEKAKQKSDNFCQACGVSPKEAKYHQWLETHECYSIYANGKMEFKTCVALCHSCHSFIHDGRMQMMVNSGHCSEEKYFDILDHGNKILSNWWGRNIKVKDKFNGSVDPQFINKANSQNSILRWEYWEDDDCRWGDYHLILYGQRYESKFRDYCHWLEYYAKKSK
ncbi:MAG: hypothetical protein ACKPCI_15055 [Dolichospermum sp.]